MKILNIVLQSGPPTLHYDSAVVLHSCIVQSPVGNSSNHECHCCQLQDSRAVFRIFIAHLRFSIDSPSYKKLTNDRFAKRKRDIGRKSDKDD